MTLDILQRLYDSEINVALGWQWDGGIDVTLQGPAGERIDHHARTISDALAWLDREARSRFPDSAYVRGSA